MTVEAAAGTVRIELYDTGHGVADDLVERIFQPFFTTRADERALGLGLPVARALAAQGGGDVRLVASRPGATLFVAEWPI